MRRAVKVVFAAAALVATVLLTLVAYAAIDAGRHWLVAVATVGAWAAAGTAAGLIVSAARRGGTR